MNALHVCVYVCVYSTIVQRLRFIFRIKDNEWIWKDSVSSINTNNSDQIETLPRRINMNSLHTLGKMSVNTTLCKNQAV